LRLPHSLTPYYEKAQLPHGGAFAFVRGLGAACPATRGSCSPATKPAVAPLSAARRRFQIRCSIQPARFCDVLRGAAGGIQGDGPTAPADRYVTLLSQPDLIQRPKCPRGSTMQVFEWGRRSAGSTTPVVRPPWNHPIAANVVQQPIVRASSKADRRVSRRKITQRPGRPTRPLPPEKPRRLTANFPRGSAASFLKTHNAAPSRIYWLRRRWLRTGS
jgi:hypothetical protein